MRRGRDDHIWWLCVRARIRYRAQMARNSPLPHRTRLNEYDPRLCRPACARDAPFILINPARDLGKNTHIPFNGQPTVQPCAQLGAPISQFCSIYWRASDMRLAISSTSFNRVFAVPTQPRVTCVYIHRSSKARSVVPQGIIDRHSIDISRVKSTGEEKTGIQVVRHIAPPTNKVGIYTSRGSLIVVVSLRWFLDS